MDVAGTPPASPTENTDVMESSLVDLTESPLPRGVVKFYDDAAITHMHSPPRTDWAKLSTAELQTLLICFGLATEGRKDELVERLAARIREVVPTSGTCNGSTGCVSSSTPPPSFAPRTSSDTQLHSGQLLERPELAVFDIETTIPRFKGEAVALLEFGVVIVDSRTLVEDPRLEFSTLVRPHSLKLISKRSIACNSITVDMVSEAPTFEDAANRIYRALDGRIWVGHNIIAFDAKIIKEHFAAIGQMAPRPAGIIDTLALFRETFGKRAGDMKMASLGRYFGQGTEQHRALADAQMTLNVLRNAGALLFLEEHAPEAMGVARDLSRGKAPRDSKLETNSISTPTRKKPTPPATANVTSAPTREHRTTMPMTASEPYAKPLVETTANGEYVHFNGVEAFLKYNRRHKQASATSSSASAFAKKKEGGLASWVKKQSKESAPAEDDSTLTLSQQVAELRLQGKHENLIAGKDFGSEKPSEDQRLRSEANRLRALRLRAQKQNSDVAGGQQPQKRMLTPEARCKFLGRELGQTKCINGVWRNTGDAHAADGFEAVSMLAEAEVEPGRRRRQHDEAVRGHWTDD